MNVKTVATALIAVLLLAACGNKGPLVLPEQPEPAEQDSPEPAPVEGSAEDNDDADPGH